MVLSMSRKLYFLLLLACDNAPMKVYGPTYDATSDSPANVDAAMDVVQMESSSDAGSCSALTTLLAGSTSFLIGASRTGSSAFKIDMLSGTTSDRPAIVPFGNGFVGVLRAANDAVQSTTFATSWADPAVVAQSTTRDTPALAVVQNAVHLIYQDKNFKFVHGTFASGMWNAANDPVGGNGNNQSFGPRAPSAAGAGMQLVIAQGGDDSVLYDQIWTGTWQAAASHMAPIQKTIPPTLLALQGGAQDLLIVYPRNTDYKIMATARANNTWTTPVLVDANAFLSGSTNEPVALAAIGGGRAVMVFRGTDSKPYFSLYDPKQGNPWTAPAALVSGTNPNVDSLPSIATGVCGADAVAAYVESGAGVKVTALTGSTWSAPEPVPQSSGAKFVAIATKP